MKQKKKRKKKKKQEKERNPVFSFHQTRTHSVGAKQDGAVERAFTTIQ